MSKYFIDHPEHVIGELGTYTAHSAFEERPRRGLNCTATLEEVRKRLPGLVDAINHFS